MIHSARPIVTPVANIVLCCFVFSKFENWNGQTDGRHVRKQLFLPAVTLKMKKLKDSTLLLYSI